MYKLLNTATDTTLEDTYETYEAADYAARVFGSSEGVKYEIVDV